MSLAPRGGRAPAHDRELLGVCSPDRGLAYEATRDHGAGPAVADRRAVARSRRAVAGHRRLPEAHRSHWPATLKGYSTRLIKPEAKDPEYLPTSDDLTVMHRTFKTDGKDEASRRSPKENAFYYYGAIRAGQSCVNCHRDPVRLAKLAVAGLKQDDLMAVVRIRLSTQSIEEGFHEPERLLISFAIGTSLLIIAGSYLIIRYVIVKPVKHLKEVSEAIAAGTEHSQ
ncbi:MAG: DUF3365 domain-containing protein [Gemmataceae bacterium]